VNSIIAGNSTGGNPSGAEVADILETETTSVVGVPVGKTLADILAGGLANHGGPTQTIALALVAGNPAIDLGTSAVCAAAPVSGLDQRGLPRPTLCDIGAYEAQPPSVATHANVTASATSAAGAAVSYTPPAGTDEQDGAATVACLPASGSTFAVGSTTVTCTATDGVGHTATGTFQVIVGAFAAPATTTPTPRLLPNTAAGDSMSGIAPPMLLLGMIALLSLGALTRTAVAERRARSSR